MKEIEIERRPENVIPQEERWQFSLAEPDSTKLIHALLQRDLNFVVDFSIMERTASSPRIDEFEIDLSSMGETELKRILNEALPGAQPIFPSASS